MGEKISCKKLCSGGAIRPYVCEDNEAHVATHHIHEMFSIKNSEVALFHVRERQLTAKILQLKAEGFF